MNPADPQSHPKTGRPNRYVEELLRTDLSTLIAARTSPELDERSREAITEFVNERHPGWSFDGADSPTQAPSS